MLDLEKDKKSGLARTHKKGIKRYPRFFRKFRSDWCLEGFNFLPRSLPLPPHRLRLLHRIPRLDIQCRLDFFSLSQSSICNITQADIIPGFKTDHSMITLSLSLHSNPRGNGFWKLNTSLLKESNYLEEIKATTRQSVNEYEDDDSVNAVLLWEMVNLKKRENQSVLKSLAA